MKEKCILKWLTTICICAILTGCKADSTFEGNKVANTDSFQMDYSILDKQEDAVLELDSGDILQVKILQTTGNVDVTVGQEGAEPIYEGSTLTDVDFTLNIDKSGDYQVSVTGHNAKGTVSFVRKAK